MCTDLHSDDSIRKAAIENQDVRILALASWELVAALAHYHRSCIRSYTKCKDGDSYPNSATKTYLISVQSQRLLIICLDSLEQIYLEIQDLST